MIIEKLKVAKILSDEEFDLIYPKEIQSLSERHWTPVSIIKIVTDFLCLGQGLKVLDIGSGVGKFCLVGASLKPKCEFYGVEFRKSFVTLSNRLKDTYRIKNVHFLNKDILEMNFNDFDSIYFYNSFQERIDDTASIDNYSEISYELYKEYTKYLFFQFQNMPMGTRLATYHTADFYIPEGYKLVEKSFDNKLKLYIKSNENKNFRLTFQEEKVNKHILRNAL
jgi:SAM-dependent methyltransferase